MEKSEGGVLAAWLHGLVLQPDPLDRTCEVELSKQEHKSQNNSFVPGLSAIMKLLAFVAFNRTFFFFFKVIRWESVALQMQFTLCDFVLFTHLWKVWNICFWFERSFRSHGRAAWFPAVCVLAPWQLCGASGALGTGWHSLPAPDPPVPLSAPWHALFHKSSPSVYHITYIVEHSISFFFFFSKVGLYLIGYDGTRGRYVAEF